MGSANDPPFATLLRNSTFVQMGNPVGKVVIGKIYHIVDDDLYVDFGGKFHCVCTRPRGPNGRAYQRGVEVKLRIKKLESSQKFLGYEKEMSLLEAECSHLPAVHSLGVVFFSSETVSTFFTAPFLLRTRLARAIPSTLRSVGPGKTAQRSP